MALLRAADWRAHIQGTGLHGALFRAFEVANAEAGLASDLFTAEDWRGNINGENFHQALFRAFERLGVTPLFTADEFRIHHDAGVLHQALFWAFANAEGGDVQPVVNLDFSSSLPSGAALARTGGRTFWNSSGLLATEASDDTGVFEYDDALAAQGLSVQGALTNVLLRSNDVNNASWSTLNVTKTTGQADPLGGTAAIKLVETTAIGSHHVFQQLTVTAGTHTLYFIVKPAERTRCAITIYDGSDATNDFFLFVKLDSGYSFFRDVPAATLSDYRGGAFKVGNNGWWIVWATVTTTGTVLRCQLHLRDDTATRGAHSYTGDATKGLYIYGGQLVAGSARGAFIVTAGAAASSNAEALTIADISAISTTSGTFLIETDATAGSLIKSGANTILDVPSSTRTAPYMRKLGISYNAGASLVVDAGGAGAAGAALTFDTSLTLLSANGFHIKSFKWYSQEFTEAELQTNTIPAETGSASPGALRVITNRNKEPVTTETLTTPKLTFAIRKHYKFGSGNSSTLKLGFMNYYRANTGQANTGNAYTIAGCYVEYNGVSVQVLFSGSGSVVIADGEPLAISDQLTPAAFGASAFTRGDSMWVRFEGSVASTGMKMPVGVADLEVVGQRGNVYDPAATTLTNLSGTGAFTFTGAAPIWFGRMPAPIVLGTYVSGDPLTVLYMGQSTGEGVGTTIGVGGPSFLQWALMDDPAAGGNEFSSMEVSVANADLQDYYTAGNQQWTQFIPYCRMLLEDIGGNNTATEDMHADFYDLCRTEGIEKIIKCYLHPHTTSTDDWVTEANQTIVSGAFGLWNKSMQQFWDDRKVEYISSLPGIRGVDFNKWVVNGTPFYATNAGDGLHPSNAAHQLAAVNVRAVVATVTLAS